MNFNVSTNPIEDNSTAYVVSVWGHFRDVDGSTSRIKKWFKTTFSGMLIRNAAITIEVEYGETIHTSAIAGDIVVISEKNAPKGGGWAT